MRSVENLSKWNPKDPTQINVAANPYQIETLIKYARNTLRKLVLLIFSFTVGNKVSLSFIGIINRLFGRPIRSIFFIYPAREKYAHTYAFKWVFEYSRRNPLVVGMYFQNFRIGLILGSFVDETYFRNNKEYLLKMHSNLDQVRRLVGAEVTHFSGILPTEMNRLGLIDSGYFNERCEIVAEIVMDAERKVRAEENIYDNSPVLLLGGKGSIGSALQFKFLEDGREVHIIDREEEFPITLRDQRAVLIDVSRKGVLESRLNQLWPNLTILNESFPEPEADVVKTLNDKGINVYHVVGVKAKAYPSFQYGYAGGIPCCAANRQENMSALIKKL